MKEFNREECRRGIAEAQSYIGLARRIQDMHFSKRIDWSLARLIGNMHRFQYSFMLMGVTNGEDEFGLKGYSEAAEEIKKFTKNSGIELAPVLRVAFDSYPEKLAYGLVKAIDLITAGVQVRGCDGLWNERYKTDGERKIGDYGIIGGDDLPRDFWNGDSGSDGDKRGGYDEFS